LIKKYIYISQKRGGDLVKMIHALIPDEVHKALRIKLAEDGANFSDWLLARITGYVGEKKLKEKGKPRRGA